MKPIRDISLRWQILLAPILLILAILAIEAVNLARETRVDADTARLFSDTVRRLTALGEADAFALEINGRMFRAMTLVQNGAPAKMVHALIDTLPGDLDKLQADLAAVARRARDQGQKSEAEQIDELSGKYRQSASQFSRVLLIDTGVAADLATSAGAIFEELHRILQGLSQTYNAASAADFAAMKASASRAMRLSAIGGVLAVVGGLALSLWLARSLTAPLLDLTRVVGALARADWSVAVPHASRGDEVGRMARAVNVFRDNGIEHERLKRIEEEGRRRALEQRATELERERAEQLRLAGEAQRARELAELTERFDSTAHEVITSFASAFKNLQETAATMGSAAHAMRERADGVSQAAVEASNNVQAIAASIVQVGQSIGEISEQVGESSAMSAGATLDADKLNQTLQLMNAAAIEIGSVLDFIKSVASRTSLLALNATIEAARAGAAGRGFAVVANEVKALATQTKEATDGVASKLERIQTLSSEAASAVSSITQMIHSLHDGSSSISTAVTSQTSAMRDISRTVQSAAAFTRRVSEQIREVQGTAGKTGEAAQGVLHASEDLADRTELLEAEVAGFLDAVRPREAAELPRAGSGPLPAPERLDTRATGS
ncbi:MAG TPA: methyl-accepting chemotaxis protein [Steroidobacteraceae bacterium]|nr:methyl-accepting chemotaxis protein [Steroidobacteraceae bacterium]